MELRVFFTISRGPDDMLTALMDVPEQNAEGVPVDEVAFDKGKLRLALIPIEGVFEGELAEDGSKVRGHWTQSGLTLSLVLERIPDKPVVERPQEPREPFPYEVEEVVVKNIDAGVALAGTLTLPPRQRPCPAVLLLSGSGAQDRDEAVFGHRPFLVLADDLTRRGIAVLRLDDRGVGGSTGDFAEATALDYAADARAGVDYLKKREEVRPGLIGLVGHSEGGMIASMEAARSPDIAFIVLIASPGLPIKTMEHMEQAGTLNAGGATEEFLARNRAMQERLWAVIDRERDEKVVRAEFTSIISEFFEGMSETERKLTGMTENNLKDIIQDRVRRLHSPWFRFYLHYDPGAALQKVSCPVLAVNGDRDVQVTAGVNLPAIERALEAGGNECTMVKALPGLNHLLQTSETGDISEYFKIEETMSPAALKLIGDWILEQSHRLKEQRIPWAGPDVPSLSALRRVRGSMGAKG